MKALVAIVFIFAFIDLGNALQCYFCSGSADCADPFSTTNVLTVDCSSRPEFLNRCWKAVVDNSVTRSCAVDNVCPPNGAGCITEQGVTTCCCDGNLCNSASTTGVSYVTLASLIIASFLGMM